MISRFLIATLFIATCLGTSGCSLFHRKSKDAKPAATMKEPKDSKTPAADLEKDFKVRWIAQRASELNAGGMDVASAQAKATDEYASAYQYANATR